MSVVPSPEQRRVLELGLDSIRIRAGAGTGKTTTVAMVVSNLVENHDVDPERVLGITFTNKAAAELSDRIREGLDGGIEDGRQVEVHTYHGFAAQILSEFASLAGLQGRMRVITPTFSRQLLAERVYATTYRTLDITAPRTIDRIRLLGDRLGDHLLQPSDLPGNGDDSDDVIATRAEMLETLERYNIDKKRLGVVDYGDLVTLSTRVMMENPQLAAEVRDRYRVLVLDEYQDTNPAQRVLLSTIFGGGFPVIAVGDEDQTIYEWRGASAENFELFREHFPRSDGGDAHEIGLTENRRSRPEILHVANEVRRRANPDADLLVPDGRPSHGEILTYWGADALAEADWIASQFEALHQAGKPWSAMAVLFRKNKDFASVVDAMRRADIPVEVANLGGLLLVPEVSDLRAWMTILERPGDSAAVAQILFGSRYRMGMADLAPLSAHAQRTDGDDDADDVPAITLLEAIEDADALDVRAGAKAALDHFFTTYKRLLIETQGASLVETCRLILDRTRAWQDMESLPRNQRLTARLNLYRVLDLAEDWSPLGGRPSLAAFLEYLDAMEDEPAEQLDSAHLSGEEAVTLVTIHRAKGLEWDVVALPVVVKGNFPARSVQHPDPARFAEHLPAEHRIDRLLEAIPEDRQARDDFFRERNALQEWRIAYVATSRPRETLIATGAYWYGLPEPRQTASEPSELFELISALADHNVRPLSAPPPRPDLLTARDDVPSPDPLFRDGWDAAVRRSVAVPDTPAVMAAELGLEAEFDKEVSVLDERLFRLAAAGPPQEETEEKAASVTGLVAYAQCPKRFFWSVVDPLPRRPNPAAMAGTELHRRIELFHLGKVPFEEMEQDLYDVPEQVPAGGGFTAFKSSRFAIDAPALVEVPFELTLANGFKVRGRIDAIYARDDHWEIVDFKSGRPSSDGARMVQLEAYAVASREVDFGRPKPSTLDVTFAYLGGGLAEETYRAGPEWIEAAWQHLARLTDAISDGEFGETPGIWCSSCDFAAFCPPGQAWIRGH